MKTNESGRSMIEMLGVLAIIGVLSVGGIAGYSKAMSVFRVNKTIDQVTQITANTRAIFSGHKTFDAFKGSNAGTLIYKSHLVPDDMITSYNNGTITMENAFSGAVTIDAEKREVGSGKTCTVKKNECKAFTISYDMIPQASCMELATKEWGHGRSSGLVSITIKAGQTSVDFSSDSIVSITQALSACADPMNNTIIWKFY